jgi:hypothetical protein
MQPELARLAFSDKRVIIWIVFVLSVFTMIYLVQTGVVLLPGHNCAPSAWPSHSKVPLHIFNRNEGRWEDCH